MQIWKYSVEISSHFSVPMPKGARLLCVQSQEGAGALWALVDPEQKREARHFAVVGTGESLPDQGKGFKYVGTWQTDSYGVLVWHLFERTEG
jgi:hypothetical protein